MKATKTLQKAVLLGAGFALAFGAAVVSTTGSAAAAWEPKKPVEFIVMAGKGGGADKLARLIQSIIAKHKLSSKPFTPINKAGGSGAEALVYASNAKDPDHTIMVTLNSFYTTPLRQPGIHVDISKSTRTARSPISTPLSRPRKRPEVRGSWPEPARARKTSC